MGRAHLWHALTAQPHAVPRDAHDGTLQRLCAGTRSGSKPRRQLGSLQSRLALGWQMGWLPTVVTRLAWSSRLARTACWLARISARSFSLLRAMRATSTSYLAWIRSRVSLARLSRARAFLRSSYVASASSAVSLLTREASLHLKISCRACLYATSMPVRALVSATRHFSSCLSSQAFASALIACRDARAACVLNEGTRSASIHSHSCIRPLYSSNLTTSRSTLPSGASIGGKRKRKFWISFWVVSGLCLSISALLACANVYLSMSPKISRVLPFCVTNRISSRCNSAPICSIRTIPSSSSI
mmetsp:Transcript_107435/g.312386  ORF Transcript_107435/g.312386 Transcript_107435/m.312386 type:complete len:302 (+) Transcript_107435:161-1066(+)